MSQIDLSERFAGCLLGLAIGDALGGHFEAQSADWIRRRYPEPAALFAAPPQAPWFYTDDTQMMIGVAQAILADGEVVPQRLRENFVANYEPQRGYGRGVRMILEAIECGEDERFWLEEQFPGGSFGNGAAMRVAPVGLVFRHDLAQVRRQAELSARPTHVHPWGIEGAQLIALAVALVARCSVFDPAAFFGELLAAGTSTVFQAKLEAARTIVSSRNLAALGELGNGIAAQDSVVTAIACFAANPDSYADTIGTAILLGGDTDTIAAMAGAISGAYLGLPRIPVDLLNSLEDQRHGRTYLLELAAGLMGVSASGIDS